MDGEVTPDEVAALLDSDGDDVRVVDVRTRAAYDRGHIPGSESMPFPTIPTTAGELAGADRVVTVCPKGKSSIQAARLIASAEGVDARVESMAGGLTEWDGELVASDATTPENDAPF